MSDKVLVIIDSNSLLNRAFYALPLTLKTKDGLIVNAVLGYMNMLSSIIKDIKPTHVAAAFDVGAPTFRHKQYADYKGTRKPMPEELAAQMPVIHELLATMNINPLKKEGYEADDVIGTLAKHFTGKIYIITGDRDLLQIVDENTRVWLTRRGVADVIEYDLKRLGEEDLTPDNIVDLKALMGDASDNIPGVLGIGEKTAKTLIKQYGTIENLYEKIDEFQGKLKEKLIADRQNAELSKVLAKIDTEAPIDCFEECYEFKYPFAYEAKEFLSNLGMKSVIAKFEFLEADPTRIKAPEKTAERIYIEDISALKNVFLNAKEFKEMAFVVDDEIAFGFGDGKEYIVRQTQDLLNYGNAVELHHIVDEINAGKFSVIVYDLKTLMHLLKNNAVKQLNGAYFDVLLAAYLIDCNQNYNDLNAFLEYYALSREEKASSLLKVSAIFKEKLKTLGLNELYYNIEFPLISVLFDMENNGFRIDKAVMEELSEKYTAEINMLAEAIYKETGEKFNINSPKQLNAVLYDKLKLPTLKKNKSGWYSTGVDILNEIADLHNVVPIILKYRQYTKMQSTYIDGFRNMIDSDGRIHTIFKNTLTTTGRLSSVEPNMQNIPIRDSEGREIRRMFIASDGCLIVSADYSQVELRLMAAFSGDENLLDAFLNNEDIHTATASKIFDKTPSSVTKDMRRAAKAVNFGIIYGISDFGLSNGLGISVKKARDFIEKYFELYPKVKAYMEKNVAFAKENGYIKTYFNRIRFLPDIKSSNYNVRTFNERAAMNMPLQGSAADIMKIAMLNVSAKFKENKLKSRLIMTVHDELVVDAYKDESKKVKEILKYEMENVVKLSVPLTVEMQESTTWLH
ncbi:MAG: DNA polymerase I [Clostridiales bacterium]|jgi:DNA polymerase-1|nr:DNA polymerase I [Clostridiales bacterium]